MPAKRSLRLEGLLKEDSLSPSKIQRKERIATYSPTAGTCQMNAFASPTSSKEQKHRNGPSNGKKEKLNNLNSKLTERKASAANDSDEFMMLLSKVEESSEKIMEIMKNLTSIQALKDKEEFGNVIGIACGSNFLREMQKTKELMTKVIKQRLFEKRRTELPKELHHPDSYELLKASLNKGIWEKCPHYEEHQLLHLPDHI